MLLKFHLQFLSIFNNVPKHNIRVKIARLDVTHDNVSYTVTSNFDAWARKFGYQKQSRLNALYSARDIFINFSIWVCVPVAIYYFGFPVFIDMTEGTNKRMNERTDGQLSLK